MADLVLSFLAMEIESMPVVYRVYENGSF